MSSRFQMQRGASRPAAFRVLHLHARRVRTSNSRRKQKDQKMEAKQVKKDVEALICNHIGRRMRERSFDPAGRGTSTVLDDLAHYDLAISVALWWLNEDNGRNVLDSDIIGATSSPGTIQYPNRLEREAMILSTFAGIIMSSLPVEEILALYRRKPVALHLNQRSKGVIVYPFPLSYHPFAMLRSYKAMQHSRKQSEKLNRWLSEREKSGFPPRRVSAQSSSASSSSTFLSDGSHGNHEAVENYEGSQESLQD